MKRLIFIFLFWMIFISVAEANWKGDFRKAGLEVTSTEITATVPIITTGASETTVGVGDVIGDGATLAEYGDGVTHKTVLTLTDVAVVLTDAAAVVAYGGTKVYTFPEGYLYTISAVSDIAVTKSSAGVDADWAGDFGFGSVTASSNTTLATTEQNILPTTATPAATAGVTTSNGVSTATEHAILDGHTTAIDLFLNYLVDDADQDVTTTPCNLILNGTITVLWTSMGDN